MALAHLSFRMPGRGYAEFEADIGTSTCYQYLIGRERLQRDGLERIGEVTYASPLVDHGEGGPFRSVFSLRVPAAAFETEGAALIQLRSYRNRSRRGVALSRVVEVHPLLSFLSPDDALAASLHHTVSPFSGSSMPLLLQPAVPRSIPFSFRESRLSTPMFWDVLLQVARQLAPQIVGSISSAVATGGGSAATNSDIVRIINAVMDLVGHSAGAAPSAGPAGDTPPPAPAVAPATASPAPTRAAGLSRIFSTAPAGRYSHEQVFPLAALLPLLPALAGAAGPLLQNLPALLAPVMQAAPQLLQTVADSPARFLSALGEFSDRARSHHRQSKADDLQHIEHLLASLNQHMLMQQLLSAGAAPSAPAPPSPAGDAPTTAAASLSAAFAAITGHREGLAVSFQKSNPLTVNGKPKYIYRAGGPIKLVVQILALGSPPPKAILDLRIKNASTQQLLLEKAYRLKDIPLHGIHELELLPEEAAALPLGTDLTARATVRYRDARGAIRQGSRDVHIFSLCGNYVCKEIGPATGAPIPLTDRVEHRGFWNKIWEGGTKTKKRWELAVDARYYLHYGFDKSGNGRIETRIQSGPEESTDRKLIVNGRLKSGLQISPVALNALLPRLGDFSPLDEEKLRALQSDEWSTAFNTEATARLEMKGRDEEAGAVWVYPEISVHAITHYRVQRADDYGQVVETVEEQAFFPKPSAIHFLGEKTA